MPGNDRSSTATDRLPPSCRYVLDVLERADGELTRQELLDETELPERTLDEALERLENQGKIDKTRDNSDLRKVVAVSATI
jgi:uncharacterized membrane protein